MNKKLNTSKTKQPRHLLARQAIERVLQAEGGYVNNPVDNGGETNFGITKRWYPHLDIKNLTATDAAKIYFADYWLKNKCDKLTPPIAAMVFDTAVNQGSQYAIKTLQKIVGVSQDGLIGNQTLSACLVLNSNYLLIEYTQERALGYAQLVQNSPSQAVFLKGWLNRIFTLLSECQPLLNSKLTADGWQLTSSPEPTKEAR